MAECFAHRLKSRISTIAQFSHKQACNDSYLKKTCKMSCEHAKLNTQTKCACTYRAIPSIGAGGSCPVPPENLSYLLTDLLLACLVTVR